MNVNPFDLLKNIGDISNQLKNIAPEKIIEEGESGGGLVKLTLNGKFEIVSLQIDEIAVNKDDVQMLCDLIIAAHNAASTRIIESMRKDMLGSFSSSFAGGFPWGNQGGDQQ